MKKATEQLIREESLELYEEFERMAKTYCAPAVVIASMAVTVKVLAPFQGGEAGANKLIRETLTSGALIDEVIRRGGLLPQGTNQ
jgi:hypothetical protein